MSVAVKLEHVDKDFLIGENYVRIIHDINLELKKGELTMLVGPSGCGKTTLISMISGILSVTNGNINVMGIDLNSLSDHDKVLFRRKNIGFIFQQYNLLPALTAAENAAMPLFAAEVEYKDALAKAKDVLAKISMLDQADKCPRQLSGGQQQRVAIARALVHNPFLIVCDEPTAALDAKTGHEVMEIMRKIANDSNRAVLVVTHDNRIYKFADRIIEMRDGAIYGDFLPSQYIHDTDS